MLFSVRAMLVLARPMVRKLAENRVYSGVYDLVNRMRRTGWWRSLCRTGKSGQAGFLNLPEVFDK
jgi:hypothetical protein